MLLRNHTLVFTFLILIGGTLQSKAQVEQGASVRFLIPDYQGLISGDYGAAFSDHDNDGFIPTGVELGYYRSLNDAITLAFPARIGMINFPNSSTDATDMTKQLFWNVGVQGIYSLANGTILKKDIGLSPYVLAGLGATYLSKQDNRFTYDVPIGLGLNWRMNDVVNLQAQSEFHLSAANHLMHSVGLLFNVGETTAEPEPKPVLKIEPVVEEPKPEPADKDGDGVIDADDKCPDVAGLSKFNGCPDTDNDGIQDSDDKCPDVAGLSTFNGCPDTDGDGVQDSKDDCPNIAGKLGGCPDGDNDGIKDSDDNCPTTAGIAKFNGCPDTDGDGVQDSEDNCPTVSGLKDMAGCPDADGDGIENSKDKCPTVAGVAANDGCPQVKEEEKKILEFAKRGVKFRTGSNQLTAASYKILDDVAQILINNPDYNLRISGYTDSQGKDATNLALSKRRAKACHDYIMTKGVASSRMSHNGFGEANPVATNSTATGRAQNRRVEFEIYFAGQ
jgi:outer membrane protein OmpA-like peptidoglycan-associated protein